MLKDFQKFQNTKEIYNFFQNPPFFYTRKTKQNNNISSMVWNHDKRLPKIMLVGGVHGNETEGVAFVYEFCRDLLSSNNNIFSKFQFCIIPILNPDGFLNHNRCNSNKVDLNRNLPTKDWTSDYKIEKYYPGASPCSEIENQFFVDTIKEFSPNYIISFHSWKPVINVNGPAMPHAIQIQKATNMEITKDIGYPTPGSLGTYSGLELNIPTITLEIERGLNLNDVYSKFKEGVWNSFYAIS